MEQQIAVWGVQVPKKLDDILVKAVKNSTFANKSDFIRDAVRRRLEEMGFLNKGEGAAQCKL
jgi:Arc/MetJ-type ribon-helix-helix transcriptional regulator